MTGRNTTWLVSISSALDATNGQFTRTTTADAPTFTVNQTSRRKPPQNTRRVVKITHHPKSNAEDVTSITQVKFLHAVNAISDCD